MPDAQNAAPDLMDELNSGEMPPFVDPAPVPAPSCDEALTVPPPAKPTAIRAADVVHATRAGGKGWRVFVKGEYRALAPNGGKGKISKEYATEEFGLPNLDAALSVIMNKLLDARLRRKYPDFCSTRTCKIVDAQPMSPETPASNNIQYMTRAQLVDHIGTIRAPIDPAAYLDVVTLRDAVIDFTLNPKGFEAREATRQQDRKENAELAALNPDIIPGE